MRRTTLFVFFLIILIYPVLAGGNTVTITNVESGNLIYASDFRLHLVGIKAPELGEPNGQEAYTYLKAALEGQKVKLFTWTTDNTSGGIVRDEHGIAYGEIWYGPDYSLEINAEMLKLGLAIIDPIHMPDNKAEEYKACEDAAKKNHQGIWAEVK